MTLIIISFICADCGSTFTGNRRKRCQLCRRVRFNHKYTTSKKVPSVAHHCKECGELFDGIPRRVFCSIKCASKSQKRDRRHKVRAKGNGTKVYWQDVYQRDKAICQLCNEPVRPDVDCRHDLYPSLDHVMPISLGGSHTLDNVQLAHRGCNWRKGNNPDWKPDDWRTALNSVIAEHGKLYEPTGG